MPVKYVARPILAVWWRNKIKSLYWIVPIVLQNCWGGWLARLQAETRLKPKFVANYKLPCWLQVETWLEPKFVVNEQLTCLVAGWDLIGAKFVVNEQLTCLVAGWDLVGAQICCKMSSWPAWLQVETRLKPQFVTIELLTYLFAGWD